MFFKRIFTRICERVSSFRGKGTCDLARGQRVQGYSHQPPEVNYLPCFKIDDLPCILHVFHVVCRVNNHSRNRVNSSLQVAGGWPTWFSTEREFFTDNLLVRIDFIIVMIGWTGLAPWEYDFPFPGSLTSTFLNECRIQNLPFHNNKVPLSGGVEGVFA